LDLGNLIGADVRIFLDHGAKPRIGCGLIAADLPGKSHWGFPPVGSERCLNSGGMLLWLSGLSVVLVCGFCIMLAFKQRRAGLIWSFILCIMAVAVLVLASGLLPV
jgi:hypothetical protein